MSHTYNGSPGPLVLMIKLAYMYLQRSEQNFLSRNMNMSPRDFKCMQYVHIKLYILLLNMLSLRHKALLSIPPEKELTDIQKRVIENMLPELRSHRDKLQDDIDLYNMEYNDYRKKYYSSLLCSDLDIYVDECIRILVIKYNFMIEMRNVLCSYKEWTDNFVEMDCYISKVLASPNPGMKIEELDKLIRGIIHSRYELELTNPTQNESNMYQIIQEYIDDCVDINEKLKVERDMTAMKKWATGMRVIAQKQKIAHEAQLKYIMCIEKALAVTGDNFIEDIHTVEIFTMLQNLLL